MIKRLIVILSLFVYCIVVLFGGWAYWNSSDASSPLESSSAATSTRTITTRCIQTTTSVFVHQPIELAVTAVSSTRYWFQSVLVRERGRPRIAARTLPEAQSESIPLLKKQSVLNALGEPWGSRVRSLWFSQILSSFEASGLSTADPIIVDYGSAEGLISVALSQWLSPMHGLIVSVDSYPVAQDFHRAKLSRTESEDNNVICEGFMSSDLFAFLNERAVRFDYQFSLSWFHNNLVFQSPRYMESTLASFLRNARTTFLVLPTTTTTFNGTTIEPPYTPVLAMYVDWYGNRSVVEAVEAAALHYGVEVSVKLLDEQVLHNRSYALLRIEYLAADDREDELEIAQDLSGIGENSKEREGSSKKRKLPARTYFDCDLVTRFAFDCREMTPEQSARCVQLSRNSTSSPRTQSYLSTSGSRQSRIAKAMGRLPFWPIRNAEGIVTPRVSRHFCRMSFPHHHAVFPLASQYRQKQVLDLWSYTGDRFLFKPSCRPVQSMFQYQGVAELLALAVAKILEFPLRIPCVFGTTIRVTVKTLDKFLSCPEWKVDPADGLVPVDGAAIEFLELRHYKQPEFIREFGEYFDPEDRPQIPISDREKLREYIQYVNFQYLIGNIDGKKNFFRDDENRLLLVDNGLAFGGEEVNESVCSTMETLLKCSRFIPNTHFPGKGIFQCWRPNRYQYCLFHRADLTHLKAMSARLETEFTSEILLKDRLLRKRLTQSGSVRTRLVFDIHRRAVAAPAATENLFSEALQRFIHGCPGVTRTRRRYNASELIGMVRFGVQRRIARLLEHAQWCAREYGDAYVYQL